MSTTTTSDVHNFSFKNILSECSGCLHHICIVNKLYKWLILVRKKKGHVVTMCPFIKSTSIGEGIHIRACAFHTCHTHFVLQSLLHHLKKKYKSRVGLLQKWGP